MKFRVLIGIYDLCKKELKMIEVLETKAVVRCEGRPSENTSLIQKNYISFIQKNLPKLSQSL